MKEGKFLERPMQLTLVKVWLHNPYTGTCTVTNKEHALTHDNDDVLTVAESSC